MDIVVVNKRDQGWRGMRGKVVYIGRGSAFGNRFVIGKDGDREQVIESFREWAVKELARGKGKFWRGMRGLKKDAEKGRLILECFCKPRKCHGDVIKELIENGSV